MGMGPRTAFTGAAGAGAGASENIQKFKLESKRGFIEKNNISRIHKSFAVNENNDDDNHEA